MAYREDGNVAGFIESFCEIHGRFGDKVYRRKRNGQPWVYEYKYVPKYPPTVLSRRTKCVVKVAAGLSNPRYKGYKEILQKIYYYTLYFVYGGCYDFTCNTFFNLRMRGIYGVEINGMRINMNLAPRSKLNFVFKEGHDYEIKCYYQGRLYCERKVQVIGAEEELEEVYNNWFAEHLAEILTKLLPYFEKKKVYRRGIIPPVWLQYMVGKTESWILYRSSFRERFMYSRQPYEHAHTEQGDYYFVAQKQVTECWKASSPEFKQVWEKYHIRWFDANYRKNWNIVRQHNL